MGGTTDVDLGLAAGQGGQRGTATQGGRPLASDPGRAAAYVSLVDASGNPINPATGASVLGATLNTSNPDYSSPNAAATGTQIIAANANRKSITLKVISGFPLRVGMTAASVANATAGHHVGVGGAINFSNYSGALFGNGVGGVAVVSWAEEAV